MSIMSVIFDVRKLKLKDIDQNIVCKRIKEEKNIKESTLTDLI